MARKRRTKNSDSTESATNSVAENEKKGKKQKETPYYTWW